MSLELDELDIIEDERQSFFRRKYAENTEQVLKYCCPNCDNTEFEDEDDYIDHRVETHGSRKELTNYLEMFGITEENE